MAGADSLHPESIANANVTQATTPVRRVARARRCIQTVRGSEGDARTRIGQNLVNFSPLGDRAVVIQLGASIDEATHRLVRAVCARLDETPIPGLVEYVPAFASVTIHYDPPRVATAGDDASPHARIVEALRAALANMSEHRLPPAPVVEIPVCYGGDLGPDLQDVARAHDLSLDDVVAIHAGGEYLVYMVGFMPGFAYLGGLSERIATPRRPVPRTVVPAGTVGIGGSQTGVYPLESPGGWNLIGRTPQRMFLPEKEPPTRLEIGDRVRFRPISRAEYDATIGV